MSDFVRKPLLQQLNKDNPITRIEVLESRENVKTSAIINSVSELSSNLGEMTTGQFNFYNPNTGQLVGYLSSVPLPGYPSYYFVMTDAAGNVQFSVDPSTSGGTTMGNGNVAIAENGVTIANGVSSYILKDVSGSAGNIYLNSTTDNILEIRNQASAGVIKQIIIMTDGTKPSLRFLQDVSNANAAQLTLDVATNGSQIGIGGEVIIWGGKDGKETVFNEGSYDVDFRVEGATNTNLFKLDAGLDAIGLGKAPTSDYLVEVNGSVNLAAGSAYKIAGANLSFLFPMGTYLNLNPITASSQAPFGGTVEASLSFVSWAMGFYTAGAAHSSSDYYTFTLKLRQGAAASDVTIATLNTKTLTSNNGVVFSTTTFSPTGVTGTGYLYIISTKTGAPSDVYVTAPALRCTLT